MDHVHAGLMDSPPKTGTTIVACVYDGGVVLGADSRVSTGIYVSNRASDKMAVLADTTVMCRSGSAADTEAVAGIVRYHVEQIGMERDEAPDVKTVAQICNQVRAPSSQHTHSLPSPKCLFFSSAPSRPPHLGRKGPQHSICASLRSDGNSTVVVEKPTNRNLDTERAFQMFFFQRKETRRLAPHPSIHPSRDHLSRSPHHFFFPFIFIHSSLSLSLSRSLALSLPRGAVVIHTVCMYFMQKQNRSTIRTKVLTAGMVWART